MNSSIRWACLAAILAGSGGCGGPTDASKDPLAAPQLQAKADAIERYKGRAGAKGKARPAAKAAGRPDH